MKKYLFLIVLLLFPFNILAASLCDYNEIAELNSEASKLKVFYEEASAKRDPSTYVCMDFDGKGCDLDYNYFKISILNMSPNFYLTVKNNVNDETHTLRYSDAKDGIVSFDWKDLSKVATFTISVYTTDKTSCPSEKRRTMYLTTPMYNSYSQLNTCDENKGFTYCEKYISKDITYDDFVQRLDTYTNEKNNQQHKKENMNWFEKIIDFILTYKVFFIIGIVVIVITVSIIFYVRYTRRKKVIR